MKKQNNHSDPNFIFITGGVFSSLGKGIVSASVGCILTDLGYNVAMQKWDPYLNVDPGTMSPYQHGEVFVTKDGAETDLDLGNYERFLRKEVDSFSNVTAGKIYNTLINRERRGTYLGKTIQVIPGLTNVIEEKLRELADRSLADFVIVEVGGTVGDVESIPFLETIRQLIGEPKMKGKTLVIHCAPLIFLKSTNEYKTKPLQHSIRTLSSYGIIADLLVVRSDTMVSPSIIDKISFMCNVDKKDIFKNPDLSNTYFLPEILFEQKIHQAIFDHLNIPKNDHSDLTNWKNFTRTIRRPKKNYLRIGLVGKYIRLHDAYISVLESLKLAGYELDADVQIVWIDARSIDEIALIKELSTCDGILVPGGFGAEGNEMMIAAARYARENKKPYLGICLGMQLACIEFARNVLKLADANTSEFIRDDQSKNLLFWPMQNEKQNLGGTLRLGDWEVLIKPNSFVSRIYRHHAILRRHRHRYEFNNHYVDLFEKNGFIFSGKCVLKHGDCQEIFELKNHPFFVGCQYHPEFDSKPLSSEPLFHAFLKAMCSLKRR